MQRTACSNLFVAAIVVCVAMTSPVQAGSTFMFQLTQPGLVSTLDVSDVSHPVSSNQIKGLVAGAVENAAGYDPVSNRFYYVNNLENSGKAVLDYLQLSAQGSVVSQNVIGTLPSPVTLSFGADYYDGRMWISQNNTNMVYGFDPNHFGAAPIVLTLPTPASNSSTNFNLGDLTFNDAAGKLFIAGSIGSAGFIYEYTLNGTGTPSLFASRSYTITSTDPMFNGIIFDQSTGTLYGYAEALGHLYTIDTTTLTVATDVGTNPALFQFGDLAGFAAAPISIPEPTSMISLATAMSIMLLLRVRTKLALVRRCDRFSRPTI
jgi:hypothetical protein